MASFLTHLECAACGYTHSIHERQSTCQVCGAPLFCRYGLCQVTETIQPDQLESSLRNFWRWHCLLPVQSEGHRLSIGEGDTPTIRLTATAHRLGMEEIYVKDESGNPTGSIDARGFCVVTARARELGVDTIALASAGNSGGAAAAYASVHKLQAHIYMPKESYQSNRNDVMEFGGHLHLVDGPIENSCRQALTDSRHHDWYHCSSFYEPYRLEGMKTVGLEIARTFQWKPPDWIIYPAQTGLGLTGIWKAFVELNEMGWLRGPMPRLAAISYRMDSRLNSEFDIHAEGRNAAHDGQKYSMPVGFAVEHNLKIIKESNGTTVSIRETELDEAQHTLSEKEGMLFSLPGTAATIGLSQLVADGTIRPDQRILLINTASGLKSF